MSESELAEAEAEGGRSVSRSICIPAEEVVDGGSGSGGIAALLSRVGPELELDGDA